eukprot:jgi/Undpi1/10022/HiC_scaffold_28.g12476.m1
MAPLDARIKKSTEEWVKSKAVREQRRRELEAEECTFYPSLGAGPGAATSASGGRSRRSSSAGPRARANASRPAGEEEGAGAAAARAFEASSSALQKARDARLKTLRKQRLQLDLQEETMFQPVGGFEGGGHRRRASAGSGKARDSAVLEGTGGGGDRLGRDAGASATGDMSAAQRKEGSSRVEKKEVIGFKAAAPAPAAASTATAGEEGGAGLGGASSPANGRGLRGEAVDLNELSARLQQLAEASPSFVDDRRDDGTSNGSRNNVTGNVDDNHRSPPVPALLGKDEGKRNKEERGKVEEEGGAQAAKEGGTQEEGAGEQAVSQMREGAPEDATADHIAGPGGDIAALSSISGEDQWRNHEDVDDGVELGEAEEAPVSGALMNPLVSLSPGAYDSAAEEHYQSDGSGVEDGGGGEEGAVVAQEVGVGQGGGAEKEMGVEKREVVEQEEEGGEVTKEDVEKGVEEEEREVKLDCEGTHADEKEEEGESEKEGKEDEGRQEEEEEGEEDEEEDEEDEEEEEEDEGDEEPRSESEEETEYSYTNGTYDNPDLGNQRARSLADFDRAQREIEAKLRAL